MDHRPVWLVLQLIAVAVCLFCSSADGRLGPDEYTEAQCRRKCRMKEHVCVMVRFTAFICCNKSDSWCQAHVEKESELLNFLKPNIDPQHPCRAHPCQHGGTCYSLAADDWDPSEPPPYDRLDPPPYDQVPPPPYHDGMRLRRSDDQFDDFYCVCAAEYTGIVCEIAIEAFEKGNNTDCERKTCKNGKCIKTSRVFKKVEKNAESTVPVAQRQDISNTLITSYKFKNDEVCVCDPGYRGMTCIEKCDLNTWGFYCLQPCHEACSHSTCDFEDGECECRQGYFFSEESSICVPELGKDKCKEFCNKKHGTCVEDVCRCNKDYYGGEWCDTHCSDFPRPRWNKNCIDACFSCATQPCDPKDGTCPLPPGRPAHERCIAPFKGLICNTLPGDQPAVRVYTDMSLYKGVDSNQEGRERTDRLCSSAEALSKLRKEVTVAIHDAISVSPAAENEISDGVVVDVQSLSTSQLCTRLRRAIKERRQAEENDNIEVQAEIYTPSSDTNASKAFRKAVKAGMDTMGRTFKSTVVPGLRVNKDSIKVSEVEVVLASDIAANAASRNADSEPISSSLMTLVPAVFLVSLLIAMIGAVMNQLRSKSGGRKTGRARIKKGKSQRSKTRGKVASRSLKKRSSKRKVSSHETKRVSGSQVHQSQA